MSEESAAAAVATPAVETPVAETHAVVGAKPAPNKPRPLPPHAVVVFNDDLHTFDYVIETFQKVFGYSTEQATLLALQIDRDGRGIVWSGTKELAELKLEQIRSAGPDIYASKKVDWPLGAVVEPLPG